MRASRAGHLPLEAQHIGSHWSREVHADVVALNWPKKAILVGECKWGTDKVAREVAHDLFETKTPKLLRLLPEEGKGWSVHYALFSRAGFTPAARDLAESARAILVDFGQLDRDLAVS